MNAKKKGEQAIKTLLTTGLIATAVFVGLSPIVFAEPTLKAEVQKSWTVDEARAAVMGQSGITLDLSAYQGYDPEKLQNKLNIALKKLTLPDRTITLYTDDGGYSVARKCEHFAFYYDSDGYFEGVDYSEAPFFPTPQCLPPPYPIKGISFDAGGKPYHLTLTVKDGDDYLFNPDGSLETHWVGAQCFKGDGRPCGARVLMHGE